MRRALIALIGGLLLIACNPSPEAARTRGGGPGADPGNHGRPTIRIHDGAQPFYETPTKLAPGRIQ